MKTIRVFFLCMLMTVLVCLSMVACQSGDTPPAETDASSEATQAETTPADETTPDESIKTAKTIISP